MPKPEDDTPSPFEKARPGIFKTPPPSPGPSRDTQPPRPSPRPNAPEFDAFDEPGKTPAHGIVTIPLFNRKLDEARAEGEHRAKVTGLSWGAGLIVAATGLAFLIWFKAEAMAQEKVDAGVEKADAHTTQKLEQLKTDVAVLKNDVATVKEQTAKSNDQQAEIIRLLKRKREP